MIQLQLLLTTLGLIFIGEIGDKTQLVTLSLTSANRSPVLIFIATSLALSASAVLATLLGTFASFVVPGFTQYVAAALFIIFGLYMLFVKEPPAVKQHFLDLVLMEKWLTKAIPRVFRKAGQYTFPIMNITRQEQSHSDLFRLLIKEKTLFDDDLNEDKELETAAQELQIDKSIIRKPFPEAVAEIIRKEKATVEFYSYIRDHLDEAHHQEDDLQEMLNQVIMEEKEHLAILQNLETAK